MKLDLNHMSVQEGFICDVYIYIKLTFNALVFGVRRNIIIPENFLKILHVYNEEIYPLTNFVIGRCR